MPMSEEDLSSRTSSESMTRARWLHDNPPPYPGLEFIDWWALEIDKEFQNALQSNMNFVITPPFNTLKFDIVNPYTLGDLSQLKEIAYKCMDWWTKAIELGEPRELDEVIAVVNDAENYKEPLFEALYNIVKSPPKETPSLDIWFEFHKCILDHARKIKWVVTEESSTGTTKDFIEYVE